MTSLHRITAALLLACAGAAHATTQQICIKDVEPGSDWYLQFTTSPTDFHATVEWFFEPTLANPGIHATEFPFTNRKGIFTYALDQLNGTVFEGRLILINTVVSNRKVFLYDPLVPQTTPTMELVWEPFGATCRV